MSGPTILAFAAAALASLGALLRVSSARRARVGGMALVLLGWAGLVVGIAPASVRDRWPLIMVALVLVAAAGWLLGGLLRGREHLLLGAGALVLSLRVVLPLGDDDVMLLAPLYLLIGLATCTLLRTEFASTSPDPPRGRGARLIDLATAVFPALAAASLLWSFDRDASTTTLAFFLVPFVLAYAVVRAWTAGGVSLVPAAWGIVTAATVAACVAIYQAVTYTIWWNPKVMDSNLFRSNFRVNSLYWDPNMLGRVLVVACLLLIAHLVTTRLGPRMMTGRLLLLALLGTALWHTFSQSSWVALGAAALCLAVLTLPSTLRRVGVTILAVLVLVGAPLAAIALSGSDRDGRAYVARAGLHQFAERPLAGHGIGSFEAVASAERLAKRVADREAEAEDPHLLASHTTPVTVLAELGVLGGAAYLLLIGGAAAAALARWRAAGRRGTCTAPWPRTATIWATGTIVALIAHSMLYAGFFEDATLWVCLAVLASRDERVVESGRDADAQCDDVLGSDAVAS